MSTRRLAAIFAADVAGFSAMMERDEEGTAARIRALRAEVIEPALARHHGRLVKTTGDGFLAEFASPVEAVRSALAIQDQLASANGVSLRIGINLGDIIIEDDGDVFGDGVNVAARLEQIAKPGTICISDEVHRYVAGKVDRPFEDKGEQQVKNISRPVRVYALSGFRPLQSEPKPLPLPDKPSIAVLPFTNMSGDREQEYLCDGLVDDIITALSRVKWFFVIARNSSFTYKGRAVDIRQVGRELGVRYVLEGSIRKAGGRLRITGQLLEASTGNHVWADRFEGDVVDVFELQDRITESVARAIEPGVRMAEVARARAKTDNLDAYDLYLRASAELYDWNAESFQRAEGLLRKAIEQDGNYAEALATLAICIGTAGIDGWKPLEPAIGEGLSLARRAAKLDHASAEVLAVAAHAEAFYRGSYERSEELAARALQLNPNSTQVRNYCGSAYCYGGDSDRAIEHLEAARRINPVDPRGFATMMSLGAAHFWAKRFEETVSWTRRVLVQHPNHSIAKRYLAASLAHLGRIEEARDVIADLLRSQPQSSLSRSRKSTFRYGWMMELYIDGLRKAGLPE
jgi:adenylate cyclase